MAELKDSGARRDFGTGAVRDAAEGKGRCDLLPLSILLNLKGGVGADLVLEKINAYLCFSNTACLEDAIQSFMTIRGWDYCTMLLEVSKQFEDGAKKYGDNNWRSGIPLHCYIDSALRHYIKWCRGDTDEPHDRAVCWNLLCAIWTHTFEPEMIDFTVGKVGYILRDTDGSLARILEEESPPAVNLSPFNPVGKT